MRPRRSSRVTTGRATGSSRPTLRRRSSHSSSRSKSAIATCAGMSGSSSVCSPWARKRRARPRPRPSRRCTNAWGLSGRNAVLGGAALATLAAGTLHYLDAEPVLTFGVAGVALAGLAWVISVATESVGQRFGPAVTGALQSTLGNLPELFIVLFALSAGELVVARTSIMGSLFANGLLVLGLAIMAGARAAPGGVMRFRARLPQDTATLLLLAIAMIVLLGLSDQVGDRASTHQVAISVIGACVMLTVYGVWLFGYLRSDEPREEAHTGGARTTLPFKAAIGVLAASGVAAAP